MTAISTSTWVSQLLLSFLPLLAPEENLCG